MADKDIRAKLKTKWADWTICAILIINLLRQLFNFLGVAIEGHYRKHEAYEILSTLDEFSRNCGHYLINNLMQQINREAVLNLGFAIFAVFVYFYCKDKK